MPRSQNFFRPWRRAERPLRAKDLRLAFATWASRSGQERTFKINPVSGPSACSRQASLLTLSLLDQLDPSALVSAGLRTVRHAATGALLIRRWYNLTHPFCAIGAAQIEAMAIKKAKQRLRALLGDDQVKVIALSGDWGTGKSHMWRELQREAGAENKIAKALYVSLFGLTSAQELKTAVVLAPTGGAFKHLIKVADKGLKRFFVSLEDEMIALSLPGSVKDRLVVFDDIERKSGKLEVDEVLGFIESLRQTYGTRFLLILNESRLGDGTARWNTLREKVIDEEVRLNTSADEAAEIGLREVPSRWASEIRTACLTCDIRNIRIVMRIGRVVNGLFGLAQMVDPFVARRLVPRVVLLAAIHFEGMQESYAFEDVLSFGTPVDHAKSDLPDSDPDGPNARRRARFEHLMHELGIEFVDQFEHHVVDFLKKGEVDEGELQLLLRRYLEDVGRQKAHQAVEDFIARKLWSHDVPDKTLLTEAGAIEHMVGEVSPHRLTAMLELLEEMDEGKMLADRLAAAWASHVKAHPPGLNQMEALRFGHKLHPLIEEALDEIDLRLANAITLREAVLQISLVGLDSATEHTFLSATANDYEDVIKSLTGPDLLEFVKTHLSLVRGSDDDALAKAVEQFTEACKRICTVPPTASRLPEILRRAFRSKGLEARLDVSS